MDGIGKLGDGYEACIVLGHRCMVKNDKRITSNQTGPVK
jgi:hypothetical protein